jgi:hypothetical protein
MKKFLIGCAVVIASFVLLGISSSLGLFFWVKSQMPDMKQVEDARKDLIARYGRRDEFVPEVTLRPERIELFLAVRESLLASRAEIGQRAQSFVEHTKGREAEAERNGVMGRIVHGVRTARGGFQLFREGAAYVGLRAGKLQTAGMGEGEYSWLYGLMSFAWLQWDPRATFGDAWFDDRDIGALPDDLQAEYRRLFMRQLRNQRRELEDKAKRSPAEERMLERVQQALSSSTFPFQNDLPAEWAKVLEPYRARFTATLPKTPGEYIVESVDQLGEKDEKHGFRFERHWETRHRESRTETN